MTQEDALYRFRLRTIALAGELGNVRAACRYMGIHPSTYYRWHGQMVRYGLEVLRPRERRRPRMPNAVPPMVEHRVLAFALGHPGFGPRRIAAELRRPKWGELLLSPTGVYQVLRRHGLNTRSKRLALVAGYAAPPERDRPEPPVRHLHAERPGALVQMDCFFVGRLTGAAGAVWQYTAIDVASAYAWAEVHVTPRNPAAKWTTALARRVAADLKRAGWTLEKVLTDSGGEFGSDVFTPTVTALGARHRRIASGRPQTNGCVERLHGTILEECWKPAFARFYQLRLRGLEADLNRYLQYYNHERAHTGRWTQGRTPVEVIGAPKMWSG
ncbi:MAG TPA: helix-turn-helix domain-containing protein [Gemmatimonadota bacterium]|nr:helix-turn-helix domain-containing protein [Gemmatimonadota bacterium]